MCVVDAGDAEAVQWVHAELHARYGPPPGSRREDSWVREPMRRVTSDAKRLVQRRLDLAKVTERERQERTITIRLPAEPYDSIYARLSGGR